MMQRGRLFPVERLGGKWSQEVEQDSGEREKDEAVGQNTRQWSDENTGDIISGTGKSHLLHLLGCCRVVINGGLELP